MNRHKDLADMPEETKGLLLIDGAYNTLLIPFNSNEMKEIAEHFIRKYIRFAKRHKLKSELNADINAYLKREYKNELKEGDAK